MIGAGIYGFVDYKKTNQNKAFTNMYKEKEVEEVDKTSTEKTEPSFKKEIASNRKVRSEKKEVAKKNDQQSDESTAPIKPIAEDEKMIAEKINTIETTTTSVPVTDKSIRIVKKRKMNTKLFSRGALD
jgi:hypothetical protein